MLPKKHNCENEKKSNKDIADGKDIFLSSTSKVKTYLEYDKKRSKPYIRPIK